jgi:hypothetical protein
MIELSADELQDLMELFILSMRRAHVYKSDFRISKLDGNQQAIDKINPHILKICRGAELFIWKYNQCYLKIDLYKAAEIDTALNQNKKP